MALLEEALFSYLSGKTGITSLLAAVPATISAGAVGIYPSIMPQDAPFPCIVFDLDSDEHEYTLTGSAQFCTASVAIDCYGRSYAAAKNLGAAVASALNTFAGTQSGVPIQGAFLQTSSDESYVSPGDLADRLFWVEQTWQIIYTEPAPALA